MNKFKIFKVGMIAGLQANVANGLLLCDGQKVGTVEKVRVETEDSGYNGYRTRIHLNPAQYDITGACKGNKLALTIKK